jgi:hypothetical protein
MRNIFFFFLSRFYSKSFVNSIHSRMFMISKNQQRIRYEYFHRAYIKSRLMHKSTCTGCSR